MGMEDQAHDAATSVVWIGDEEVARRVQSHDGRGIWRGFGGGAAIAAMA